MLQVPSSRLEGPITGFISVSAGVLDQVPLEGLTFLVDQVQVLVLIGGVTSSGFSLHTIEVQILSSTFDTGESLLF